MPGQDWLYLNILGVGPWLLNLGLVGRGAFRKDVKHFKKSRGNLTHSLLFLRDVDRNDSARQKFTCLPSFCPWFVEVWVSGSTRPLPCAAGFQSSLAWSSAVLQSFSDWACAGKGNTRDGGNKLVSSSCFTSPAHFVQNQVVERTSLSLLHLNTDNSEFHREEKGGGADIYWTPAYTVAGPRCSLTWSGQ